jgi:hypothetical protein
MKRLEQVYSTNHHDCNLPTIKDDIRRRYQQEQDITIFFISRYSIFILLEKQGQKALNLA